MNAHTPLLADDRQIKLFVNVLFRHARKGTFVSLRTLDQFAHRRPPRIEAVPIGSSLDSVVQAAALAAQRSAETLTPTMFAPPIATFDNSRQARAIHVANGLAITVDLDHNPLDGLAKLLKFLGSPTILVESGSRWADPVSGELIPKLHAHWRLEEPSCDAEGHERLREARRCAAALAGGDSTGASIVHPFRWPGTWNRKKPPGTLARIVEVNAHTAINLGDALQKLQKAVASLPGFDGRRRDAQRSSDRTTSLAELAAALMLIPNEDPEDDTYYRWIEMGMVLFNESDGSAAAFTIWDEWSARSGKYRRGECARKWGSFGR